MKKLLVLAMVLVFAAMPMFAEVSIGGEFDYYMVNGFEKQETGDPDHFADKWDKGEVDIKATVGDYSKIVIEIEEDGSWAGDGEGNPSFNYFRVQTDWGKFFGLEGIGIKTDIGLNSWETFDAVDFTGYNYEYADNFWNPATSKDFGFKINLSFVDGLVQPYYAMSFDTIKREDTGAELLVGVGLDFNAIDLPLWLEGYFWKQPTEKLNLFGVEAMYDLAISDFDIKLGGFFQNHTNGDDRGSWYGFGAQFNAFGATIDASFAGCCGKDYWGEDNYSPFSTLGISAQYFFLDWLGVNAGANFAFGDYKENCAGDKAFQGFEAGVIAKPDKGVCYKLGYIYVDEDVAAAAAKGAEGAYFFRTLNTKGVTAEKGGLYFVTKIDF